MFWIYLGELFRRVFFPTTRGADYISVLLPLAASVTAFFLGVRVSEDTTVQILAYVGVFTLLAFLIRLLVAAPFAMWKDEVGKVAELKLELSKPEQMVLEHMSRHQAKMRKKLIVIIHKMQMFGTEREDPKAIYKLSNLTVKANRYAGQCGFGNTFGQAVLEYGDVCREHLDSEEPKPLTMYKWIVFAERITDFASGKITDASLLTQLPPNIEAEIQP